tara:strand:- start:353 stop:1645 length:1293 start_codon:yes stop_codon:yes gene_type:complete
MSKKIKRVSIFTQGCRLNKSESQIIEERLILSGFKVVPFDKPADISIINTCTVTENGDRDARKLISKTAALNMNVQVGLVGCLSQIQKEKLLEWPNVNWVIGTHEKLNIAEIILNHQEGVVITPKLKKESFEQEFKSVAIETQKTTRANLKIQDGCDFYCAFCIIPFARGPARSRVFKDILKEANLHAKNGIKELVITGVNIGTYENERYQFMDIIHALEEIDGIERIRISSIEPTTIPNVLIEHMAKENKLCRYLHIPIQSATNDILELMKRKYTLEEFDEFIQFAYQTVPDICIGTDVIVGFPGETDLLFEQTESYLRESPIHYFHVFSYSERQFARSQKFDNQVPLNKISERSKCLRDLSQRKKQAFYAKFLDTTQNVLFEKGKEGLAQGLTEQFIKVQLKTEKDLRNQLLPVSMKTLTPQSVLATF